MPESLFHDIENMEPLFPELGKNHYRRAASTERTTPDRALEAPVHGPARSGVVRSASSLCAWWLWSDTPQPPVFGSLILPRWLVSLFMWHSMWHSALPWWEFILRGLIIYVFLLVLLRLTGKRQVGQLAPFDLVLLLVLSNAVQNAMNGGDNSITGGMISAGTLVAMNALVAGLTFNNKTIEGLVEGRPEVLIHNGKLYVEALQHEKITHHELMT